MDSLLKNEQNLHGAAKTILTNSPLMAILGQLGKVIVTGSYQTRLMVYPDIDFAVLSTSTNYNDLVEIIPQLQSALNPTTIKIADFSKNPKESAVCYLGLDFEYSSLSWHISATVTGPGPIGTDPPELKKWLTHMSADERKTILKLKKQLIDSQRYAGSHSKPPYTFRSVHLYEAVLVGKAKNIKELEQYFA